MSGFAGFGGFGQNNNNNQQQGSGFGGSGFGQSSNSTSGFGSTPNNTGFGSTANTGGSLFGGTSGGFGSSGGAFGTPQQSTGFGAKPTFGASTSTGGGLFGSNTATANTGSAFGGFGSTNTATSSPFGAGSTGGGLFGQANKPAFGAASGTTSSPFGGATTTGFGSTPSAFGGSGTALGAAVGDCQGTGAVPFQPYVEKEPNSASNQQNSFQSIVFQQPYQKFSPEELRLADYAQGRKYANASGQAGAFGTSSGFGGFGNNNTTSAFGPGNNTSAGLFGSTSSSTPFGQNNQNPSSGFGSTNTVSLFGNKPATTGGGLFGSQAQAQAQAPAPSSTGIFGSTGSTGFGGTNTTGFGSNTNTGTSLFSNNNQNKSGFSFGNQQPATTGTGFGTTTNTGTTGGFGSGPSLFGNNTSTQNTSTPFGGTTQAASSPFGGFGQTSNAQTGTTSLFGNNQQKPAGGIFGNNTSTASGTGLFGNTTNPASNPFGSNSNNTQTTSLFAPKPAPTLGGSGMFGNNNNNNNATTSNTGGLFGNSNGFGQNNQNQQNQNSGSGLFGSLNQQQPKPSLFGAQNQPTGSSPFGSNTNTQGGNSLFGSLNNNNQNQQPPQQQTSLFGGSFGGSQQNQQSQPQSLTASISDPTAFGTSMFSNLATPQIQNPGPLATPLSSLSKQKKNGVLPMYKMNPASASRFATPQKRGFGFSYNTYGTPGSASSTSSIPLTFGNSMLGGGLNRGLSKSVSTSSLRGSYTSSFNREDSILAPGAFSASPSSRFNSTGSMKKLVINRGIRTDLFSPPSKESSPSSNQSGILKKRVSFDASTVGGNVNGHANGNSPLKQVQSSAVSSPEESGYIRSSARSSNGNGSDNGSKINGAASPPEMEQVKGNELAIVPEEEAPAPASSKPRARPSTQEDQEPGRYWMKPSNEEIMDMNRMQRQKVTGFTVGRDGVGQVAFDTPVDLTNINLDGIFDKLVILNIRQATVYPDQSKKPPVGKGLNVPSTIKLENSWPRGKDKRNPSHEKAGPRFQKHIERLSKVPDTEFKDYDKETGVWTFTVEHFTTYGLEYDDDENDGEAVSEFGQSTLSAPPDTPTPHSMTSKMQGEHSFSSTEMSGATESDPEDTFDFKKKKILPGAFNNQVVFEDDVGMEDDEQNSRSFLDERSVGSQSENGVEEPMDQDDHFRDRELVGIEDQEMAGSYPQLDNTAEQDDEYSQEDDAIAVVTETPGAIMRARMRAMRTTGSPLKRKIRFDDNDWAEMLWQSVSPQKQDREQLKRMRDSINDGVSLGGDEKEGAPNPMMRGRVVSDGRGFATSIDLMHSLFGEARSPVKSARIPQKGRGFEWPYAKQSKTSDLNESDMDDSERAFHDSLKPSWDINGTLVYAAPGNWNAPSRNSRKTRDRDDLLVVQKGKVVSEARDILFARFSKESFVDVLKKQKSITAVTCKGNVPYATLPSTVKYSDFFEDGNLGDQAAAHEKLVWELASVLFDAIDVPYDLQNVPAASKLLRKEKVSTFWQKLVGQACNRHVAMAKSSEEKAIACLSGHRISEACGHLLNGKNFHLATLVALIGGSERTKKSVREQLNEWQKSKVLSEFSQPIRAIYELLAGNVCVCEGTKGAPIEDRIQTFIVSKRFGLDWRQAFGLRLWYAILGSDDIGRAVELFAEDLGQDKETAKPQAWYAEQGIPPLWNDEALDSREDLLWGLLKLYANRDTDLESVLRPENSQLSPLNIRLSWQLSRALMASGKASYGNGGEKADQLTLSFAAQLTNEGNWVDAAFVLLHLSSSSARTKAILDHLAHHAGRIGPEEGQTFISLAQDLRIPRTWIWEAKALYMRSVQKDPRGEVECLLRAGAYEEAHRTFSREVAPITIIERDWDTLRALLVGFKGQEASIVEWHLGGELYADYLHVVESQKKGIGKTDGMVLERLLASLPAMVENGRHASFLETVAVQEISGIVAHTVVEMGKQGNDKDLSRVLRLPLTEDKYLRHTADLSLGLYKGIMAGGR